MNPDQTNDLVKQPPLRWWQVRMMWLVVGGPLVVVVASFATLMQAINHPDPVIPQAAVVRSSASAAQGSASLEPAIQARNHAATPRH